MTHLVVEDVSKAFVTRDEPLVVLRDISLELAAGQNVAIVGPSGSGKSTLLNIIGTLEPPTSGRVFLEGEDLTTLEEPLLAGFRSRKIGFVFQDHHLLPQCSVLENVLVPTLAVGRPGPETVQRARELLDRVGLSDRLEHRPAELSGGERQRVALARALVNRPVLLVADEPTGNLDRRSGLEILAIFQRLHREGRTIVVVTHDPAIAEHAERVIVLRDGRIVEDRKVENPRDAERALQATGELAEDEPATAVATEGRAQ